MCASRALWLFVATLGCCSSSVDLTLADKSDWMRDLTLADNSNWMRDLPEQLQAVPLHTIAIPGSHDSFGASLTVASGLAPNAPKVTQALIALYGQLGDAVSAMAIGTIYNWASTQSLSLSEQLQAGIRYFDLRICSKPGTTLAYMCHALYTQFTVDHYMVEINTFLEAHPKEVVLLEFQWFYSVAEDGTFRDDLDDTQHQRLIEMITRVFGSKLRAPRALESDSPSLAELWGNDQQVILLYNNANADNYPDIWRGNSSYLTSPWPKQDDASELVEFLEDRYSSGRPASARFYVTQGVLTASAGHLVQILFGSLHDSLAIPAAEHVVEWLKTKQPGPQGAEGINIVILDFVEMEDFIDTVIGLNYNSSEYSTPSGYFWTYLDNIIKYFS